MIQNALHRLAEYIKIVPVKFLKIPEDTQLKRPAIGKWSKREILGHLIDSALHNWQRMAIANDTEGPYVAKIYKQAELVRNNAYQQSPPEQLTALWSHMNQQILVVCRGLNAEQLKKEIHVPYADDLVTDLAFLIVDYVEHMEHHLKQIFGSLEALDQMEGWQIGAEAAARSLDSQTKDRFITLKKRGSLLVEYYAPQGHDPQQPHAQDEIYVVIEGSGDFYCDGKVQPFKKGDLLFVPAGIEHRFENFTADFATWVVFYGPEGGEIPRKKEWSVQGTFDGREYSISLDKGQLDLEVIAQYLKKSYWANKRPKANIKKSLDHCLTFGIYHSNQQVGLARVVTDFGVFGYLADVFVLEEHQGIGLGKWLMETIIGHPDLQEIKWYLVTKDAQGLYEKYGFALTQQAEKIMEREAQ